MPVPRAIRVPRIAARAVIAVVAIGLPVATGVAQPAPQGLTKAPPLAKPTLVVQITVDQLRPDYLDRYASQFTGGLKRLLAEGAFFTQAYHDYAPTETAPGHATLWSGRFPRQHGIITNTLGVADPQMPLVFGRGGGASPWRFRGSALFDWIRGQDQFSRALSVSRKDRGAILPIGRARQPAFWYSTDGRFTTSRYYGDTVPTWVQRFNAEDPVAPFLGRAWTPLLPDSAYRERDDVPWEHGGKEYVFPHRLSADRRQGTSDFVDFPWMDDLTVDFALRGVEAMELGKGLSTDVLAISLSTTDAIGHAYGPDSKELHDQILRLDRNLGRLIDSLYALRDSSRIIFAVGADHGVTPYPEATFPGTDPDRGRVDVRPVIDRVRSALAAKGIEGDALIYQDEIILLDRDRLQQKGVDHDSLVNVLRSQLLAIPGMLRVDRASTLQALAARGDKLARRWWHAIPPDYPAVLTVTFKPGYYPMTYRSATHGMPHDLDAHIPVLFMGPGFRPGRYPQLIRSVDVAPTLAARLGVPPTEPIDGRVLSAVLTRHVGPSRLR